MVDPNRKINHLTDDDVKFLNECEAEFKDRYTENDEEFMKIMENTEAATPPLIFPWRQGGGGSGRGGQQGNYRGGNGGGYHRHNQYHDRGRPYNNDQRGGGSGGAERNHYRQNNRFTPYQNNQKRW